MSGTSSNPRRALAVKGGATKSPGGISPELVLRSERKLGEISARLEKGAPRRGGKGGGSKRGPSVTKTEQLAEAGIPKQEAARCETIAAPSVTFAEKLANDPHARHLVALVEQGDPRVNLDLDDAEYLRAVRASEREARGGAA